MSNYGKGDWQAIWDGLFWTFMDKHRNFFSTNPRLGMLLSSLNRMKQETKENHFKKAEEFLRALDHG
jgi:deoxyribodipyrimidine photolyase-related protein